MTEPEQANHAHAFLLPDQLDALIERLREQGYRTVGPRVVDGAIVYRDVERADELPHGYIDTQDGGRYRLVRDEDAGAFDHVVGPDSLKRFVFPSRDTVLRADLQDGSWTMTPAGLPDEPVAVIGVRGCDLQALAVTDRVFLEGPYVDPLYEARRRNMFLVAVNCRRAAATCFCHSMNTGPAAGSGFDLAAPASLPTGLSSSREAPPVTS
ncbi:MAG: hypothetical protein R3C10_21005 [Pirellulales bacterium]